MHAFSHKFFSDFVKMYTIDQYVWLEITKRFCLICWYNGIL